MLKDDLTLDSYGIKSGSTLHIIKKTWPEPEVKPGASGALMREYIICEGEVHLVSACFSSHRAGEQVCCRQRVPDASGRAALQRRVQRRGTHCITSQPVYARISGQNLAQFTQIKIQQQQQQKSQNYSLFWDKFLFSCELFLLFLYMQIIYYWKNQNSADN